MKKSQGSILAIVMIMVGALYLLAGMIFIINQQYFADMLMARDSANNRQKLLTIGQENVKQFSKSLSVDEEWQDCDVLYFPAVNESADVFLQRMRLANHCHDAHIANRIWLASLDNIGDRLVIDQLMAKEDWQHVIEDEIQSVNIQSSENAWEIVLHNGELSRKIVLIESEELPKLIEQKMRINQLHYEIVLMFENDIDRQVMIYHLWIPIAELHFDKDMLFEFHLSQHATLDHIDIVAMNVNDSKNPNWQMLVEQKDLDFMLIKHNVLFVTFLSKEQSRSSIIGVYLKGSLFFDDRLVGFEYPIVEDVIELMPCLYRVPLIVAEQWQIGCDVQQKIRYYFPE